MEEQIVTLSQIVDDQKLRDGFQRFLDRNLMGEQLLFVVEVDKFSQLDCPSQKNHSFTRICNEYVLSNCRTPLNISFETLQPIRDKYQEWKSIKPSSEVPGDIFSVAREEAFVVMETSCLPLFIRSPYFNDLVSGNEDYEFSRQKAEWFFGMRLEGKIQREEILEVFSQGVVKYSRFKSFLSTPKTPTIQEQPPPSQRESKLPPPSLSGHRTAWNEENLFLGAESEGEGEPMGIFGVGF